MKNEILLGTDLPDFAFTDRTTSSMNHFILISFFILITSSSVVAQYDLAGLDLDGNVTEWFDQSIGKQNLRIVSGDFYEVKNRSTLSHKFYLSNKWALAEIDYYGNKYTGIYVLYDVVDDQLLIRHPTRYNYFAQPIRIHQARVKSFSILDHAFRYYEEEESPPTGPGFYEELYLGNHIDLIVKRKKEENVENNELFVGYRLNDQYFLRYQDTDYKITRRRSIIKSLKPYKKQLRQYIRQYSLKLKVEDVLNDRAVVELLRYCDGIIGEE